MPIIWPCPLSPPGYAELGRAIAPPAARCPSCHLGLIGWGGYWRWIRAEHGAEQRLWIRRGRCPRCRHTHALLPSFLLIGRLDVVQVIGAALHQAADGVGARTIARHLALPHTTVRDWWRRVRESASSLLAPLLALATSLDPAPVDLVSDGAAAVIEVLSAVWQRAERRGAGRIPDRWACWSLVSGGFALRAHTHPPFPDRSAASSMAASLVKEPP